MAIAKMKKLHLIGMAYDRDRILNALHKTNAAEITYQTEQVDTAVLEVRGEALSARIAAVEAALTALVTETDRYEKERGIKSSIDKDGFDVSYTEFISVKDRQQEAEQALQQVASLVDRRNALKAEWIKAKRELSLAKEYENLRLPFSIYKDTAHTRVRVGTLANSAMPQVIEELSNLALCTLEEISVGEQVAVAVYAHKNDATQVDAVLAAYGFTECPYKGELTGEENAKEKARESERILTKISALEEGMYALKDKIRLLKIYCDYLCFELEKERAGEKMLQTQTTLLLEAYVPEKSVDAVTLALNDCASALYMEFTDPTDEDEPPTLLENNAVVGCFEGITNTFAPPNYRELDPNLIMGIFYSIFMGFIIGDAGYGIMMLIGGGILWWKGRKRPTGVSRLAGAFAVGGVFAIIWGLLFNSLFGFSVFEKAFMPNAQTDMWLLAGISVPSVLIICMVIGVVHLMVGYLCKAVQEWRRGNVLDGLFDGVVWALFSVGVGLVIVGFTKEAKLPELVPVGGITAGMCLLTAMLTAGRHAKGFGKVTKGFGAAYGVINYASDILSYARLYGLMLSGAVIAGIIADYSGQFIASGNVAMILLAVVLLVIGNGFNLVMNLLGAYIHDARLQYVEFYGKFYEGEGELFRPLGSAYRYISVISEKNE